MPDRSLYWALVAVFVLAGFCGSHTCTAHPLDPLSREEIAMTVALLRDAGNVDYETRFALIELDEPAKSIVLAREPTQTGGRRAFVIARQHRTVFEGLVNLDQRIVQRWQAVPKAQSRLLVGEIRDAQRIVSQDPGWQAAMRLRGYDPASTDVFCAPLPAGYFGQPEEQGRRLLNLSCFDTIGSGNVWGRPIEGLYATVDLDESRVVRLIDRGPVPVSTDPANLPPTARASAPTPTASPVTFSGNEVHWKNWSFHYRISPRSGLILSLVRYRDGEKPRMVLYRGSLSEIFVPYMDREDGWSSRAPLEVGEFGIGPLSLPLTPDGDCPSDAAFLGAVLADDAGTPHDRGAVICLFERETGMPLWRHAETADTKQAYAGRLAGELVMRTIPSIGSYDYVIDWVLTETGVIRIDVGATGIVQVKGVASRTMADPAAAGETVYGGLVAPNLVGVNHDHFLSLRLDLDIDGDANTLVRQKLVREHLPGNGGRRSLWRAVEETIGAEGPLSTEAHGGTEVWRIINPNLTNSLGQHPGYELRPGHSAISLLSADDFPQRRAAFSAAPLWLTAYERTQLYAAGAYPNQSRGGDGLPAYVAQQRPVANADIVLWYTMGFHHLPRPEDWPVMPTVWHSVPLVPYGFFDRNPALNGVRN